MHRSIDGGDGSASAAAASAMDGQWPADARPRRTPTTKRSSDPTDRRQSPSEDGDWWPLTSGSAVISRYFASRMLTGRHSLMPSAGIDPDLRSQWKDRILDCIRRSRVLDRPVCWFWCILKGRSIFCHMSYFCSAIVWGWSFFRHEGTSK